jgi:hypothetical protein
MIHQGQGDLYGKCFSKMNIPVAVRDWLLEPENPSVRFRTLTDLLGAPQDDPDVQKARAAEFGRYNLSSINAWSQKWPR